MIALRQSWKTENMPVPAHLMYHETCFPPASTTLPILETVRVPLNEVSIYATCNGCGKPLVDCSPDRLLYHDLLHDGTQSHLCNSTCMNYAVIQINEVPTPVRVQERGIYFSVATFTFLDGTLGSTVEEAMEVIRRLSQPRMVGYMATNETGTHYFCRGCVTPTERVFGTLVSIRATSPSAHEQCHLCDLPMALVTHKA